MQTKNLCNTIYKDLCAELGQLQIQKESIDKRVQDILAQISLLNQLSPKLQDIETNLTTNNNNVTAAGC